VSRTEDEARTRRAEGVRFGVARDGSTYRWPGGVVPYVIQSSLPNKARVTDAMAHIVANTNKISFVQRTTQANYVEFRTSTGCSSSVGRVGGRQYINLADGCSTGNTIHEILHALGMYHEQTRCDRDTFVTIHTANITSGYEGNFTKKCTGASDYSSYAEGSIMHYGPYAFSKNGLKYRTGAGKRPSVDRNRTISSRPTLPLPSRKGWIASNSANHVATTATSTSDSLA
jgi:hypothetical protein